MQPIPLTRYLDDLFTSAKHFICNIPYNSRFNYTLQINLANYLAEFFVNFSQSERQMFDHLFQVKFSNSIHSDSSSCKHLRKQKFNLILFSSVQLPKICDCLIILL